MRKSTVLLLALVMSAMTPSNAAPPNLDDNAAYLSNITSLPVRPFSTRDFGRDRYSGARSVLVPAERAEALLTKIRTGLAPGLVAFIGTENSLADDAPEGVELVIGPGSTQFDILRVAASDAVNYGKQTEDLIKVLQRWHEAYGIDIFQASTDTIQLRLQRLPPDVDKFAAEVYEFCPDIVDQGVGSVAKLAEHISKSRTLYLWWD